MNWLDKLRKKAGQGMPTTRPLGKSDDEDPRVQIYDVPTGSVMTIPARELAHGMVSVHVNGVEGNCWVRPDQLQKSPYQHSAFDEDIRAQLIRIKAALDEVYGLSLEEWEDGFRRDTNAEREIAIWLHIAEVYACLTESRSLALPEKTDIFRLLLGCANNPRDQVLATAGVQALSRPEAEAVMAEFYGKPS